MTGSMVGPSLGYGALELKRAYQHNLLLGILIASLIHVGGLAGFLLYRSLTSIEPVPTLITAPVPETRIDLVPLPALIPRPQSPVVTADVAAPSIGIPVPTPDEDVTETVRIPTQTELAELNLSKLPAGLEGTAIGVDSVVIREEEDYFPAPGEFVAHQEPPRCVYPVPPIYPEMARLTNREGSVVVLALVQTDGSVRQVMIGMPSGTNVGFDEAAMEAVSQYRFRPAIQNGRPVAVWVSQRIDFRLH